MKRRDFLVGAGGAAVGAAGGAALASGSRLRLSGAMGQTAPGIIAKTEVCTTWKIQTSWPEGVGLDVFREWAATIVEKTSGELAVEALGATDLVGEFQLFDAVRNGRLEGMNPFTLYWAGQMPAAVFLASYPLGLRHPHEWDVFYYGLGGLEIARELFAGFGLYYLGPVHHGPNIIHSKVPIHSIEDFAGRRMRLPGGMVAEVFQAAGAKTTMLPGSKIFDALADGTIDVADYVGPAVNHALGFHEVTDYISMGPPGFMSLYQPVDLMDLTISLEAWNAISPELQDFLQREVHVYSDMHHAAIQKADQAAWAAFDAAGTQVTRLSEEDVTKFTRLAVPRWFAWANKDKTAARVFQIQLDYMMSGSLGYVTPDDIAGQRLRWS